MDCMQFLLGCGGKFCLDFTDKCLKSGIIIIPEYTLLEYLVIIVQMDKKRMMKLHRVVLVTKTTGNIGNNIKGDGLLFVIRG